MEAFPALLALCEGNPPVTNGFPSQRPVMRSFRIFLSTPEQTVTIETPVNWDAIAFIMTSPQCATTTGVIRDDQCLMLFQYSEYLFGIPDSTAKTLRSTSTRHRSFGIVLDRCLIDLELMFFYHGCLHILIEILVKIHWRIYFHCNGKPVTMTTLPSLVGPEVGNNIWRQCWQLVTMTTFPLTTIQ